ncbi:MAG: ERF family protein [Bacillota bacterium]
MHMSDKADMIIPEFYQFQQDVQNPKKTAAGQGYKYMTLDDLIDHTRKAMAGRGLSFSQEVRSGENGEIELMTRIYHTSGQWLAFGPLILPKDNDNKMNQIQQAGSAITYARRYSLAAALGIASEEDNDGQVTKDLPEITASPASVEPPEPLIDKLRRYYRENKGNTRELIDKIIAKDGSLDCLSTARKLHLLETIENN